ncbi:MAG: DUF4350 domain-containing protein [Pseudomonadota bacterium]
MSDRQTTILGALGSILLLAAIFYQPAVDLEASRPTSEDEGRHGYAVLYRWLEAENVPVKSLRQRLSAESLTSGESTGGNVLMLTLPAKESFRSEEIEAVGRWLSQGNTLLLVAALNDSPNWLLATSSEDFFTVLERFGGLTFEQVRGDEGEFLSHGSFGETPFANTPNPNHPLMFGVDELSGITDSVSALWEPRAQGDEARLPPHLQLASDETYQSPSIWALRHGKGHVIVVGWASLLGNTMLKNRDNAQFLANLLAYHRSESGALLIDDFHQGLSEVYDPEAFFSDSRLHTSIGFLVAFWFLYLLGISARLSPVEPAVSVAHQSDLVHALSNLMTRKLTRTATATTLIENWLLTQGVEKEAMDMNRVPWEKLAASPRMDPQALREVEASYGRLGRGEKVNLRGIYAALVQLNKDTA